MSGSTLHTIAGSLHENAWLFEQLAFASQGDTVLLIQDAVLATHSPLSLGSFVAKCQAKHIAVAALAEDMELRGVTNQYDAISSVAYNEFVELVVAHDKQVCW